VAVVRHPNPYYSIAPYLLIKLGKIELYNLIL
jgi:hypothetical protein